MIERLSAEQIQQKQGFRENFVVRMVKVKMVKIDFGNAVIAHYIYK